MQRRSTARAGAIALALAAATTAGGTAAAAVAPGTGRPAVAGVTRPAVQPAVERNPEADRGLALLRKDARGSLRVHRAADGTVDSLASTSGRAALPATGATAGAAPRTVAVRQLDRYGEAFGIDGDGSRAVVSSTVPSSTGGTVVRADQVVDGVPVFGGQVVLSLDEDQGVVSVDAATTGATEVAPAKVSEARARAVALGITARSHRVAAGSLEVVDRGRRLYDPAIVHTADPLGTRPVWEFEVGNGHDLRETVLVGTGRGEVALHFDNTPQLHRRICDNGNRDTVSQDDEVPVCATPALSESGSTANVNADVKAAYDNLGATSDAYASLDDLDLTDLIGYTKGGVKSLTATVNWCYSDDDCPYPNAFWDGSQMVFGRGYARADDVVGHELTHGYVARTAGLFYYHQSGALNESLADTIGEIVDHRNPLSTQSDAGWTLGEDLGVFSAQRSMQDPTIHQQPDKMTSGLWDSSDALVEDGDGGGVHANDGVGNKTAYLVSQGGTFNGQTVTGIDGSDAGLAKTGRLYLETIPRLTSGAEYADLGRVLGSTCDELVASTTGGFTAGDCVEVRKATAATELSSPPAATGAAAAEAPIACPSDNPEPTLVQRDDDGLDDFGFSTTSALWGRAPSSVVPSYAVSGTQSLFGYDPDPRVGDATSGSMTSAPFTVPRASGGTFLNFHHAYILDYGGGTYYDGGEVVVSKLVGNVWTKVTGLPWVNGPGRHILGNTKAGFTGFGGDSHGYGSSQVDLSSLAGQRVKVAFRIEGGPDYALYGWWIDDVRLYACDTASVPPQGPLAPTAPTSPTVRASATSAVVSWQAPADQGSKAIARYRVTRSDGKATKPVTGRSVSLSGFKATANQTVSVAAENGDGLVGPATLVRIYPTTTAVTSSTTRAGKNKTFTVTAKVTRRGTSTLVRSMPVVLQRHTSGRGWSSYLTGTTSTRGTKVWSVKQSKLTYYRVVAKGATTWFGSTSGSRTVKLR